MTSAEERAKELATQLLGRAMNSHPVVALIAQAITQAENDKLEEAAGWADKWLKTFGKYQPEHISAQRWATDAVKDVATQIRSLKKD